MYWLSGINRVKANHDSNGKGNVTKQNISLLFSTKQQRETTKFCVVSGSLENVNHVGHLLKFLYQILTLFGKALTAIEKMNESVFVRDS